MSFVTADPESLTSAAEIHQLFLTTLSASAGSYAATEATNAAAAG